MDLKELLSEQEIEVLRVLLDRVRRDGRPILLQNDLVLALEALEAERGAPLGDALKRFVERIQELIFFPEHAVLAFRPRLGQTRFFALREPGEMLEEVAVGDYLEVKDSLVLGDGHNRREDKVVIDFAPFYDYGPRILDSRRVGEGLRYLNSYMSASLSRSGRAWRERLSEFLKLHSMAGRGLLVDGRILKTPEELFRALEEALGFLSELDPETPYQEVEGRLARLGLVEGFGNAAGRIAESLEMLSRLFDEPSPDTLERFLSRVPMISKVVILSPHGWFGQEGVLGLPDTGGQVVYILDQVRALERELVRSLREAGLEDVTPKVVVVTRLIPEAGATTCNVPREKIRDTENCWILRVPFRRADGSVHPRWMSRFEIWPYLHEFALEARRDILGEFEGRPDVIIGNYSDGNLVASLLSSWLGVIQLNIAHALEKTKYLFSDLYWTHHRGRHNFDVQFTADLVAMNRADFIITSTLQEIVGSPVATGQYESYTHFTMPGLYQVVSGIDLFHPKFNVLPPGVDQGIYFPPDDPRRVESQRQEVEELLFHRQDGVVGIFHDPWRPAILSMARLDPIKNITGLLEAYALSPRLQEEFNLLLIAGKLDAAQADNDEERSQIERMYAILGAHPELEGKVRWHPGMHLPGRKAGEIYRTVADRRGVFVQPALFEAFGLTVLEAMATGLPTFATRFGGPLEIMARKGCGFLINPTRPDLLAAPLEDFAGRLREDPEEWDRVSRAAVARVEERYNWPLHACELLKRVRLYGFWRYAETSERRREIDRYCELIYHLIYKPRAAALRREGE